MKLLSILHRWTGAFIGFLLALLGLSGALLVWKDQWISLPHASDPLAENVGQIGRIVEAAGPGFSRVTFAHEENGLHHFVYGDGSGAYFSQNGVLVDRWQSQWERPELWLFDFHHHLFAGDTGETVAGVTGIVGLVFVMTGLILWWRARRATRLRLWPKRFAPGPIVAHHRDLGLIASPLLLLSMLTGTMMLFEPIRSGILGAEDRPKQEMAGPINPSVSQALAAAKAQFPDALLRRVVVPSEPGKPLTVRMRQPFEWTPNGRTQMSFAPDGKLTVDDAASANRSAGLGEKLYPLHSAKVGGLALKLAMTLSGLALAMLGSFTMWSFWARRSGRKIARKRAARPQRPGQAADLQLHHRPHSGRAECHPDRHRDHHHILGKRDEAERHIARSADAGAF
ncbi:MAG: PepSY domain-containing protein [Sphingosinicella sp.]|nr:PepSY domain-containing protein [Sphingosinicella sp.]